jgi:carboxy-terminal domain RNA polymerase II polypeptide A small phosphatase
MFRPGAQEFIKKMSTLYEIVIFTASVEAYAIPLMKKLDPENIATAIFWRDHCSQQGAMYVKDLSKLGRRLEDIILLDNSPNSYYYQPENGLPITNWYDNLADRELFNYYEILEALAFVPDVRDYLLSLKSDEQYDYIKAKDVISKIYSNAKTKPSQKSKLYIVIFHKKII